MIYDALCSQRISIYGLIFTRSESASERQRVGEIMSLKKFSLKSSQCNVPMHSRIFKQSGLPRLFSLLTKTIVHKAQWRAPCLFHGAVNRKFKLFFTFLSPPISQRFIEQLMPFSSSISRLFSLVSKPLLYRLAKHTSTQMCANTHWHAPPLPVSQPSSPQPLTSTLPFDPPSCPPLSLSSPLLPSVAESTEGSGRYMYSRLLCGCHDNRHEFDMALT